MVRIVLPHLGANLPRAHMAEWLVNEEQKAAFGDSICRVTVSDRVLIRGTRGASSLLAQSRRTEPSVVAYEEERGRFEAVYDLVAAETVIIVRRVAEVGEVIEVGALLGVAKSEAASKQDEVEHPIDTLAVMRVIARLVEGEVDR